MFHIEIGRATPGICCYSYLYILAGQIGYMIATHSSALAHPTLRIVLTKTDLKIWIPGKTDFKNLDTRIKISVKQDSLFSTGTYPIECIKEKFLKLCYASVSKQLNRFDETLRAWTLDAWLDSSLKKNF